MKKKITSALSFFMLPVLWMGVIFFLSNQSVLPGLRLGWADFILKKCAHISVYFILFLSWVISVKNTGRAITGKTWAAIFILCFLFAISDEYHQSFIPGRTASPRDVGFDMAGACLAFLWSKARTRTHSAL
jgi:VanZ family protein